MKLVYKFYTHHTEELDKLFRASNNLYNQALYQFRQRLNKDNTWLWYNDMDKLMKNITNLEGEYNYRLLKSKCSQHGEVVAREARHSAYRQTEGESRRFPDGVG